MWFFASSKYQKAMVVMRFPAKKNAGCPKAPRDSPPRKEAFSTHRRAVL